MERSHFKEADFFFFSLFLLVFLQSTCAFRVHMEVIYVNDPVRDLYVCTIDTTYKLYHGK